MDLLEWQPYTLQSQEGTKQDQQARVYWEGQKDEN